MQLPVYLTYSDFISKYENDLSSYRLDYPDLTETEFLQILKKQYLKLEDFIKFHRIKYYENREEIETTLFWYPIILEEKFGKYFRILQYQNEELNENHPEKDLYSWERNYEVPEVDFDFQLRYFVSICKEWDESEHWLYLNFIKYEGYRFCIDENKLKNFGFARTRILEFINEKTGLNSEKKLRTNENAEQPENDYSETPNLQRMIILEKLGIIDYIKSLQKEPGNEKQTAEILSSFTGINSATIAKNLGVMLGYKKDDTDKNSPYKNPKNSQLANNKLDKFNIDLTKTFK